MVLLSCLAPLMVSDLAVDFSNKLFATDASLNKGAIVQCLLSDRLQKHFGEHAGQKAYRVDFIEVFAGPGAATVTKAVAQMGFSVCCPIDISVDPELDVSKVFVMEWIIHLVQNHYVKAVMVEPPCTTFSIMRRPALRSRLCPFGFDVSDPQTSMGNKLALRSW